VRCNHARKITGHEGPAADRSGRRMVCVFETADETDPRTFRVKFVLASCARPIPGALGMGLVHITDGTEFTDTACFVVLNSAGESGLSVRSSCCGQGRDKVGCRATRRSAGGTVSGVPQGAAATVLRLEGAVSMLQRVAGKMIPQYTVSYL
jgi:hypothetical protein